MFIGKPQLGQKQNQISLPKMFGAQKASIDSKFGDSISCESPAATSRKFKRFRSIRNNSPWNSSLADQTSLKDDPLTKERELKELIFLRDLHYGLMADNFYTEFAECLEKVAKDQNFANKCLRLALSSRNEDIITVLLNQLSVTRQNFHAVNNGYIDTLLLEAVESDDLESIESILSWRDVKAQEIGLTDVDRRLLRMQKQAQEVIITAAIRGSYSIVKILHANGYKIFDKMADDRFFFSEEAEIFDFVDIMERHIDRIRIFKAQSSPAYMALTYVNDPISHAFDCTKKASLGIKREPEFKKDFEEAQRGCRAFSVAILNSCRNSAEVEMVLDEPTLQKGLKPLYGRLFRAIYEEQKEFVAHSYCQLLLHSRWMGGLRWCSMSLFQKLWHILFILVGSPILCFLYIFSPKRDHANTKGLIGAALRQLDWPFNRFIVDTFSYCFFLVFLLHSVLSGMGHKLEITWSLILVAIWALGFILRDARVIRDIIRGQKILSLFRFCLDCFVHILIITAVVFKIYGMKFVQIPAGAGISAIKNNNLDQFHPINIGAILYGVAACFAFLRMVFVFEVHSRFGPILFCIKNVVWDITSVIGTYFIAMVAFSVGLVSVFGIFPDEASQFSNFKEAFKRLFWIIFDPGKEEWTDITIPEDIKPECGKSNQPLFIAKIVPSANVSASIDSNASNSISHFTGIYIWGFYQVFVVLILLNLLISLMTATFSRIQQNADVEWKFTRASTWIHYYDDRHAIPVPFNILPSVHSFVHVMTWLKSCRGTHSSTKIPSGFNANARGHKSWISMKIMEQESLRKGYDVLIERVFRSEEKQQDTSLSRVDLEALEKEMSIDIAELRRDIRSLRRDLLSNRKLSDMSIILDHQDLELVEDEVSPSSQGKGQEMCQVSEAKAKGQSFSFDSCGSNHLEEATNERRRAFTFSYKADNNPDAVEHLAVTLGLVGGPVLSPNSKRKLIAPNHPQLEEETAKTNLERSHSAK